MKRCRRRMLVCAVLVATTACSGGSEKHKTTGPEVVVKDLAFKPSKMSVKVGDEVTWTFEDKNIAHNVTADAGSFRSENLTKGTFVHKFDSPGSVSYTCTIHAGQMKGVVEVRG